MADRRRLIWCSLVISVVVVGCGGLSWLIYVWQLSPRQYEAFDQIGSVHLLANSEEAWVFVSKSVRVGQRGWQVEFKPLALRVDQYAFVISSKGLKKRTGIPDPGRGISLDPESARIFRKENGFYLYHKDWSNNQQSMFQWKEDRFAALASAQAEALQKEIGLKDNKFSDICQALDRITEKNGWKLLFTWRGEGFPGSDDVFRWNGQDYQFKIELGQNKHKFCLVSLDPGNAWVSVLLEYDTTRAINSKERDELSNRP